MAQNKRRDITEVVEEYLCHSCGSCFASCGHDSINYTETTAGYIFPKIDYDSCTNCGLCFDVCPGDHFNQKLKEKTTTDPFVGNELGTFVGKSTNDEIYKHSQSGGVTTTIVKYLLDEKIVNAAVVTVMNDDTLHSESKIIYSSDELLLTQKSKYVPTSLTALIPKISNIDGKVAVVGLSCHMHGIENSYKIDKKLDDKIIKIGLICDRVMLYSSIDFFTSKALENKVSKFTFRDTTHTPYPGDMTFYIDKKFTIMDKKNRKKMKDFFTPVRCMLCFDKMNIYSDIVLGDPHAIDGVDRENGENLIITRTELGNKIIDEMIKLNYLNLRSASFEQACEGQGIAQKRKKFHANILAWNELGFRLPDYPQDLFQLLPDVSKEEIDKAKNLLNHAIDLDSLNSRDKVIKKAHEYQISKRNKKTFFSKIKKLFK